MSVEPVTLGLLIAIALILVVVVGLLFSGRTPRARPQRGAAEAFHHLLQGDRETARELLTESIREGRAPAEAHLHLGDLLREDGDPNRALALHQGLLARPALGPEMARLTELAVADDLLALERHEEAEARLERLDRELLDEALLSRYALALHRLGRIDDAGQALERRARLAPATATDAARYLAEAARDALREGKLDTARDRSKRARRLDDSILATYEVEGDRLMQLGRPDDAVREWREGLRHASDRTGSLLPRLADAAFRAGRMDSLMEDLEQQRDERPEDLPLWKAVTDLRLRRGDLESFFSLLESAPENAAPDLAAWSGWIRHLSALEGGKHLSRLLRLMPDSFGPAAYVCRHCKSEDPEPREACARCGRWYPLVPRSNPTLWRRNVTALPEMSP